MVEEIKPRIVKLAYWFEKCANYYVKLLTKPEGVKFPKKPNLNELLIIRIGNLTQFLIEHPKDNIWRSWEIYSDDLCKVSAGYVPLLLDVDVDKESQSLETAQKLTFEILDIIEKDNQFLMPDSLRVVFSGHKGFHIEAIPNTPVDNQKFHGWIIDEMNIAEKRLDCHDNRFKDGTIDSTTKHEFIRVTGSYNSWRNENGIIRRRKVTQYSLEQYNKTNVEDIIAKSEAT